MKCLNNIIVEILFRRFGVMNGRLLNVNEVSDFLNISKSSVYLYVQNEDIPVIRLNGRLLFSERDLLSWVDSRKKPVKNKH
jgi:predicted DNA-binding transcriptional regulator AlpA